MLLKKTTALLLGLAMCTGLSWGQTHAETEEHGPATEFARNTRLQRLTQTTRWDVAAFPAESMAPTGFAAYEPFSLDELTNATGPMETGTREGTPLTRATAKVLVDMSGTYTGTTGPLAARLKTVEVEATFVFEGAGTFRLLRTHYLFLDGEGNLLDALTETVWQDAHTRMHNYYVNRTPARLAQTGALTARVYPNPTGDRITLEAQLTTPGTCAVTLLDGTGLALRPLATVRPVTGTYRETFDVSTLPAGRYYLLFHADGQNMTIPFIKQ